MDKIEVTNQWRKKPVVVEAMKYPGHTVTGVDTLLAFEDWIEPLAKAAGRWPLTYRGQSLIIPTLEGDHEAKPGDFIIRGVSGEIYPCKPDIFAKTYEPALATRTDATPSHWSYSDGETEFIVNKRQNPKHYPYCTETPLYTHPPVTDVAALVEAAKAMDDDHMTSEHHHPGYVLVPTVAFEKLRQALAPFTKGQNDD